MQELPRLWPGRLQQQHQVYGGSGLAMRTVTVAAYATYGYAIHGWIHVYGTHHTRSHVCAHAWVEGGEPTPRMHAWRAERKRAGRGSSSQHRHARVRLRHAGCTDAGCRMALLISRVMPAIQQKRHRNIQAYAECRNTAQSVTQSLKWSHFDSPLPRKHSPPPINPLLVRIWLADSEVASTCSLFALTYLYKAAEAERQ